MKICSSSSKIVLNKTDWDNIRKFQDPGLGNREILNQIFHQNNEQNIYCYLIFGNGIDRSLVQDNYFDNLRGNCSRFYRRRYILFWFLICFDRLLWCC